MYTRRRADEEHFNLLYGGDSPARRAAGAKPHTYRNWGSKRNPWIGIMKPKRFFFHRQYGQRYSSRVWLVSDDGGVAQTWRPQPCRLGKQKGSHQLNNIGHLSQLTAVQTWNPLIGVTWPYRGLRCCLWGCWLDYRVAHDGAQGKYTGLILVKLGQLMHASHIFEIWYGRSISLSIDSCQNKVFADQYRMIVLRARV